MSDRAAGVSPPCARRPDMADEAARNEHALKRVEQRELTLLQTRTCRLCWNGWYGVFEPASRHTVQPASLTGPRECAAPGSAALPGFAGI